MRKPSMQVGFGLVLGAGIGIAAAVILGSGSFWLAVGIAVGVAVGTAMARASSRKTHDQRLTTND